MQHQCSPSYQNTHFKWKYRGCKCILQGNCYQKWGPSCSLSALFPALSQFNSQRQQKVRVRTSTQEQCFPLVNWTGYPQSTKAAETKPAPHSSNKLWHEPIHNTQPCTTAWHGLHFCHLAFLQTIVSTEKLLIIIPVSEQQFQVGGFLSSREGYTSNSAVISPRLVTVLLRSTEVSVNSTNRSSHYSSTTQAELAPTSRRAGEAKKLPLAQHRQTLLFSRLKPKPLLDIGKLTLLLLPCHLENSLHKIQYWKQVRQKSSYETTICSLNNDKQKTFQLMTVTQ